MTSSQEFWGGVLRRLGTELPPLALAWLSPLRAELAADHLRVCCPTAFHRRRIEERFLAPLTRCAEAEAGRPLAIALEVPARRPPAEPARPDSGATRAHADAAAPGAAEPQPGRVVRSAAARQASFAYRFDEFVVGPCNALAREASLALAQERQPTANPLFLTSDTGLGKTHLARAILAEARRLGTERGIYESAESFTNGFMAAIRNRRMDQFKERYRRRCDLLVIDDVQFLRSKSATQLELFHTLVHLLDAGARVVLTGDQLPRDLAGLDARLRSQMCAGLVAELEPPDARVRREILRRRAASGGVRIPEECLDLIVESVRGSVRDLEGALIQLVASASLLKQPIDVELTPRALHKLTPDVCEAAKLDVRTVIDVVTSFFGTTLEKLSVNSRARRVLVPRQLAMYLCRRYTDASLDAIARPFGRRHPSVSNAVQRVEREILERAPLRYQLEELTSRLDQLRS
jgi:chromosomal replication initiator protein